MNEIKKNDKQKDQCERKKNLNVVAHTGNSSIQKVKAGN